MRARVDSTVLAEYVPQVPPTRKANRRSWGSPTLRSLQLFLQLYRALHCRDRASEFHQQASPAEPTMRPWNSVILAQTPQSELADSRQRARLVHRH
jgi:hypothetical protein